jgi:hypothetical protein
VISGDAATGSVDGAPGARVPARAKERTLFRERQRRARGGMQAMEPGTESDSVRARLSHVVTLGTQ